MSTLDNKHVTNNHNKNKISNTDDIESCVTPQIKNYSVQSTSTPAYLTPLYATLSIPSIKLHTTTESPPAGRKFFFLINDKSSRAAKCVKSRIMNKVINYILSIDEFEEQCVVLKYMLQSPRLKYHMMNIGIDQSVSNRASFEQNFLNNIKGYINMLVSFVTKNI